MMQGENRTRIFYFTTSDSRKADLEAAFRNHLSSAPNNGPGTNIVTSYAIYRVDLSRELLKKEHLPYVEEKYHGFVTFAADVPVEGESYYRDAFTRHCVRYFPYWEGDSSFRRMSSSDVEGWRPGCGYGATERPGSPARSSFECLWGAGHVPKGGPPAAAPPPPAFLGALGLQPKNAANPPPNPQANQQGPPPLDPGPPPAHGPLPPIGRPPRLLPPR